MPGRKCSLLNHLIKFTDQMKTLYLLLLTLFPLVVHGQEISGQWNGLLKVQGMQLRVVFNIEKTEDDFRSTMDSPDQGAKGIPVTSTTFVNNVLKLEVKNAGIEYTGELGVDGMVVGTFKQGGQSFPLTLGREIITKEKPVRPQEPLKPYPYYSEEIKFTNAKASIVLAGTLTRPEKAGSYPFVVLISGSGPQNRDEELLGHKPFLVLSDYLTRNGVGVLRFDDRGTAESKGDFKAATSQDLATDVEAAISYLQGRGDVDKDKIGLIGHSEGGIIAPMVAAKLKKEIGFIVLLAGTGIRGDRLLLMQQELIGKASGVSDEALEKNKKITQGAFDIIQKSSDAEKLKADLRTYLLDNINELPEISRPKETDRENFVNQQINQLTGPWMRFFLTYDPSLILKDVRCPVLALNGSKDLQVPAEVNLNGIQHGLAKGRNKAVTAKELPNLNHLFQECKTGSPTEYATIEQTFSPAALKEISDWLKIQIR